MCNIKALFILPFEKLLSIINVEKNPKVLFTIILTYEFTVNSNFSLTCDSHYNCYLFDSIILYVQYCKPLEFIMK